MSNDNNNTFELHVPQDPCLWFLIKLKVRAGSYEKIAKHLVQSTKYTQCIKTQQSSAVEVAIMNEMHYDMAELHEDDYETSDEGHVCEVFDAGSEFHYSLSSAQYVEPKDLDTLRKYL